MRFSLLLFCFRWTSHNVTPYSSVDGTRAMGVLGDDIPVSSPGDFGVGNQRLALPSYRHQRCSCRGQLQFGRRGTGSVELVSRLPHLDCKRTRIFFSLFFFFFFGKDVALSRIEGFW